MSDGLLYRPWVGAPGVPPPYDRRCVWCRSECEHGMNDHRTSVALWELRRA
jgi:hypothetical protein